LVSSGKGEGRKEGNRKIQEFRELWEFKRGLIQMSL
jgi:hypothetical protein